MSVGKSWTYLVHGRRLDQIAQMRASRRVAVDDVSGFELVGPLGTARLAWHGTRLVADSLCGTRYDPPLPLVDAAATSTTFQWSGTVASPTTRTPGHGTITLKTSQAPFASRVMPAVESIVQLQTGRHRYELDSWFVDGIGLVRQEERIDDIQSVSLQMTGGS